MKDLKELFSSLTYGEAQTYHNQFLEFRCPSDKVKKVKNFIANNIASIDIPTTKRVYISHGGYGEYTRYNVTQYKYAGGGDGNYSYIEVLEIKETPESRWGIVINEYSSSRGGFFFEWEKLEDAINAFEKYWGSIDNSVNFPKMEGFKRMVPYNHFKPWFYAIGDEELIDDLVFPHGFQDDPIYRFGKKFVVVDFEGVSKIKTCFGTRLIKKDSYNERGEEKYYRIVFWSDGTIWDETEYHPWWSNKGSYAPPPRPLRDDEFWIYEAMQKFQEMLSGKRTHFEVNFTDGNKFVGKIARQKPRNPCAEGNYFLNVSFKGGKESQIGWVSDFKPTPESPDIVQFVTQKYKEKGLEVEKIEITDSKIESKGKKWAGAFFSQ